MMHEENLSIKINGDDSTGLWKQIKLVSQSFLGLQLIGQIWKKAVAISSVITLPFFLSVSSFFSFSFDA